MGLGGPGLPGGGAARRSLVHVLQRQCLRARRRRRGDCAGVSSSRLSIVRHGAAAPAAAPGETVITTDELKSWIRSGRLVSAFRAYDEVRLVSDRVDALGRPLPAALAARWLSRGPCYAADASGRQRTLDAGTIARWAARAAVEPLQRGSLIGAIDREVAQLEAEHATGPQPIERIDVRASPLYLRADLSFGVKAGGSIGHTAEIGRAHV